MDPAALGTTIIGLESIHREGADYERGLPRPEPPRRRPRRVRRRLANLLRRVAERIEPYPVPAH